MADPTVEQEKQIEAARRAAQAKQDALNQGQGSMLGRRPIADARGNVAPSDSPQNQGGVFIRDPSAYYLGNEPGYAPNEAARYLGYADQARAQQAAAYGQFQGAYGQSQEARQQQLQGLGYLRGLAEGTGPSAAQGMMAQGMTQARNQQASIAASARGGGGNLAAAQAASANAAGNLSLQGIQQAGVLRSQEQLAAIGQYGQQAGALRSGDFQGAQIQSGQQQLGAGQASQYEGFRQGITSQAAQMKQAAEQQALAREAAQRGWNLQQSAQDKATENTWIQAGTAAATTAGMIALAALSDERTKENVTDGSHDVDEALKYLKPVSFSYKKEFGGEDRTGIMAQSLAASKAGSKAVFQGPDGYLRVKAPEAATLALAGLARLNDRLSKVENGRK